MYICANIAPFFKILNEYLILFLKCFFVLFVDKEIVMEDLENSGSLNGETIKDDLICNTDNDNIANDDKSEKESTTADKDNSINGSKDNNDNSTKNGIDANTEESKSNVSNEGKVKEEKTIETASDDEHHSISNFKFNFQVNSQKNDVESSIMNFLNSSHEDESNEANGNKANVSDALENNDSEESSEKSGGETTKRTFSQDSGKTDYAYLFLIYFLIRYSISNSVIIRIFNN